MGFYKKSLLEINLLKNDSLLNHLTGQELKQSNVKSIDVSLIPLKNEILERAQTQENSKNDDFSMAESKATKIKSKKNVEGKLAKYTCEFGNCAKEYTSRSALNHHIKNKHSL